MPRLWVIPSWTVTTMAIVLQRIWPNYSGSNFAREVVGLKTGQWQGPVESGYGWHLVFIDTSVPARVPAFEEIEPEIRAEWAEDQRAEAKRKTYEAMRARYQVVTPEAAKDPTK
jgi:parvulin-like peptidyl-prolyl isomerase